MSTTTLNYYVLNATIKGDGDMGKRRTIVISATSNPRINVSAVLRTDIYISAVSFMKNDSTSLSNNSTQSYYPRFYFGKNGNTHSIEVFFLTRRGESAADFFLSSHNGFYMLPEPKLVPKGSQIVFSLSTTTGFADVGGIFRLQYQAEAPIHLDGSVMDYMNVGNSEKTF